MTHSGIQHVRQVGAGLGILILVPGVLIAQRVTLGVTGAWMATGGKNIQATCMGDEYRGGIGPAMTISPSGNRLTFSISARTYRMRDFGSCQADVIPPPENGTVIFENRYTLLGDKFLTTDARADYRASHWLVLGGGSGVAWHKGVDFPYGLVSVELLPVSGGRTVVGLGVELHALRVSTDKTLATFTNSQLVSAEPLPRERSWSHAVVVTARVSLVRF